MRRVLTLTLAVHWMCIFAMLAIVCAIDPRDGFAAPLRFLGMETKAIAQDGGSKAAAFFAVAFLLVAALFLVAGVALLMGRSPDAGGRRDFAHAFGAAALVLTLLLLAGALAPVPYLFGTVETILAAALASFLAMRFDAPSRSSDAADRSSPARLMALGAAHASLLSRVSGRLARGPQRRNP